MSYKITLEMLAGLQRSRYKGLVSNTTGQVFLVRDRMCCKCHTVMPKGTRAEKRRGETGAKYAHLLYHI